MPANTILKQAAASARRSYDVIVHYHYRVLVEATTSCLSRRRPRPRDMRIQVATTSSGVVRRPACGEIPFDRPNLKTS
jgi:hypothetical protein